LTALGSARFCNKCGAPIMPGATSAEYKQVTVLFADVVHSMDMAAAVGAEQLREIMTGFLSSALNAAVRASGLRAARSAGSRSESSSSHPILSHDL
jgi:class 3 adenylate cyclase